MRRCRWAVAAVAMVMAARGGGAEPPPEDAGPGRPERIVRGAVNDVAQFTVDAAAAVPVEKMGERAVRTVERLPVGDTAKAGARAAWHWTRAAAERLDRRWIDATLRPPDPDRPPEWAQPLALEGVPNLHRVSPALYRGGQPTAAGMKNLADLGVRTVVSLRTFHDDGDEIGDLPLARAELPMVVVLRPRPERVEAFLRLMLDPGKTPVYVHCQQGVDRTGFMAAAYRIVVEGWTRDAALREMTEGFAMHQTAGKRLIRFLRQLDVPAWRRRLGLPSLDNQESEPWLTRK